MLHLAGFANQFQSTLSSRRATTAGQVLTKTANDFNPRSPHGERPCAWYHLSTRVMISIHALLTESDSTWYVSRPALPISIHALLTESDELTCDFTGTPFHDFNPRSPHGERQDAGHLIQFPRGISIHALLTESDVLPSFFLPNLQNFNPRSPHGERPRNPSQENSDARISIHALLTESDVTKSQQLSREAEFQSTLSSRRATAATLDGMQEAWISIHALLTESDAIFPLARRGGKYFNPRSPHGERQQIPPNWPYRFCLKCQF